MLTYWAGFTWLFVVLPLNFGPMTLQDLINYYDEHPELQEEISANVLEWWSKEKPDKVN